MKNTNSNMRFIATRCLLVVFAMLLASVSSFAQKKQGNQLLGTCCSGINISTSITSDCCVDVTASWPCSSGGGGGPLLVKFEKQSSGGTWSTNGTATSMPATNKICPDAGSTTVTFRVKFENSATGMPWCNTGSSEHSEGYTMFTQTVDLGCCGCPTAINNWLTVKAKKDNSCPNNGCKVNYTMSIPSNNTCFTQYKAGNGGTTNITSNTITGSGGCIGAGTSSTFKFVLYKANGDSCVVEKSVACEAVEGGHDTTTAPCTPDCFNDPFVNQDTKIFYLTGCPGCWVRVLYTWRVACGTYQDVQILRMEMSPACELSCGLAQIYKEALIGILDKNVMGFNPTDTGCATTWRVSQGGCWAGYTYYIVDPIGGITDSVRVWKPCKETACCLQPMTVCKYKNPKRITITYNPNTTPLIDCKDTWLVDPVTRWVFPCSPKCDWLNNLEGEHEVGATPMMKPTDIKELKFGQYGVGVGVEQKNNILAFNIQNEQSKNVRILISNIRGIVVEEHNFDLSSNSNYFNIDLHQYQSGSYTYTVIVDGVRISGNTFIVVR